MKCFYHSADFDGICSGAIVKKFYPGAEMCPINYGDPFPWDDLGEHERIIMVDFSLQPFEKMLELKEKCGLLVWIDHHQSAIDDFNEHIENIATRFIHGILRADKAACELTWEYYFPNKPMPRAVKLLGRYDVWDHDYSPNVLPFQYGMRAVHPTYLEPGSVWWERIFKGKYIKERILDGMTILKYEEMDNIKLMNLFSFEGKFP